MRAEAQQSVPISANSGGEASLTEGFPQDQAAQEKAGDA